MPGISQTVSFTRALKLSVTLTAICIALLLTGCSQRNVSHLSRKPWLTDTPQSLEMKFWRFEYVSQPLQNGVGVRGTAYPSTERFPSWATWYDQLYFTAYLSDSNGNVLAESSQEVLPRPIGEERSIPMEFILTGFPSDGTMYISFGYQMRLLEKQWHPGAQNVGQMHIAREGALAQ